MSLPCRKVHFHLVPAPTFSGSSKSKEKSEPKPKSPPNPMLLIGHGRDELDDEEGEELCRTIQVAIEQERKEWITQLEGEKSKL